MRLAHSTRVPFELLEHEVSRKRVVDVFFERQNLRPVLSAHYYWVLRKEGRSGGAVTRVFGQFSGWLLRSRFSSQSLLNLLAQVKGFLANASTAKLEVLVPIGTRPERHVCSLEWKGFGHYLLLQIGQPTHMNVHTWSRLVWLSCLPRSWTRKVVDAGASSLEWQIFFRNETLVECVPSFVEGTRPFWRLFGLKLDRGQGLSSGQVSHTLSKPKRFLWLVIRWSIIS